MIDKLATNNQVPFWRHEATINTTVEVADVSNLCGSNPTKYQQGNDWLISLLQTSKSHFGATIDETAKVGGEYLYGSNT